MSVSIQVAVRCRPFSQPNRLGVRLHQLSDEQGEIELLNCDYSTKRFPFTYTWWSAYGYTRHLNATDIAIADEMKLTDQAMVYAECGLKIKRDLLAGNAVVLFAYGLSGSGKTFTVFGPDAIDSSDSWFRHSLPHPLWGIFPRLAYELFQEKETKDGWKISMKYFQNVVDTVRDLLSPNGEEQHYKNGMRKDPDGFVDIEWCQTKVVKDWNELRETFLKANARKAIAPTQFNPMSTRGHCIMVLEVEMPDPDNEGMKKRGRIYVCDLAGTEPAGDIFCALYNKVTYDDGTMEYKFTGEHPDKKKSKELQEQGMKINLSLSEMAQFFMKMAEAVLKKKLTPGMSIPGCNSFFLCKYLKDTMLQARTYLFCAIRPEVEFLRYTFATLGFAKNASVVRLSPKKATVAASAIERRLMAELEAMKELVARLQKQASSAVSNQLSTASKGPNNDESAKIIAELQAKLAEKQNDLAREVIGVDVSAGDKKIEEQVAMYGKRGISLVAYEDQEMGPNFVNLDEDAFRSNRFMYKLTNDLTTFGNKNDIQLMSLAVVRDHCQVRVDRDLRQVFISANKGDTWHNGHQLAPGTEQLLQLFDRVAMGDQLMILRWPDEEYRCSLTVSPMSGEQAVLEYQEGLINKRMKSNNPLESTGLDLSILQQERQLIREEKDKWEHQKNQFEVFKNEDEYNKTMNAIDNSILDLIPKTKEAKEIVDLFNRVTMNFEVVLEKAPTPGNATADSHTNIVNIPRVKISVTNTDPKLSILIDPQEFLPKLSLMKDEMMKLRSAIEEGLDRHYEVPERHDPLYLMFDNDFLLGTATHWPEYLIYHLETAQEEKMQQIKNAAVPYNTVGLLEVTWIPLKGPEEIDENLEGNSIGATSNEDEYVNIEIDEDLLGKPWTYRLEIKRAADLPVFCEMAYLQYKFFGETFTSEAVQQTTYSPVFEYTKVHHVPLVTQEFLSCLKEPFEISIHVTQHIKPPIDKISTANQTVFESIKTGEPRGYQQLHVVKSQPDLQKQCEELTNALILKEYENDVLKAKVNELELKINKLLESTVSKKKSLLSGARLTDEVVSSVYDMTTDLVVAADNGPLESMATVALPTQVLLCLLDNEDPNACCDRTRTDSPFNGQQ